jgi:mono/diheme cytochrome c family protein
LAGATRHFVADDGLCETSPAQMATPSRKKSPVNFLLFIALLVIAAGSAVYAFLHPGPWIVPEVAKQVPNPIKASQADLAAARKLYSDKCADCHGDTGKGDGAQAKKYDPPATDFTDAAHMSSVSDGELFYKISEGHRPMPGFKKRFTEEQRWQLVIFIRSFSASTAPAPVASK